MATLHFILRHQRDFLHMFSDIFLFYAHFRMRFFPFHQHSLVYNLYTRNELYGPVPDIDLIMTSLKFIFGRVSKVFHLRQ